MQVLSFDPKRSKTVLGLVVLVVGYLLQPEVLSVLPAQAAEAVRLVGVLLATLGLRDAAATTAASPPAAKDGGAA